MIRRRAAAALAACGLAGLGVSGCGLDLQNLPSPGGGPPGNSYSITGVFADVLNLPERAQVKLDGVVIGQVTTISLANYAAHVKMAIARSISLPKGTTAEIRFTTPLGEDYVSLTRPTVPAGSPNIGDGAVIPESQTDSAPTIEDTFAALSLVLNGGGLDQLRTIIGEVNMALGGHEGQARDLLTQLNTLATALSSHSGDIDRALDALNSLSAQLNSQSSVISNGLQQIAPALQVLASEASDLNSLLTNLGQLGVVGSQVIEQSSSAFVSDLQELGPVLDSLVAIRGSLGGFLSSLHSFEGAAANAAPGDYLNLVVNATATLGDVTPSTGTAAPHPASGADAARMMLAGGLR